MDSNIILYESGNNYTDGILDNSFDWDDWDEYFEAENMEDTHYVMERIYPKVQAVLKTSYGDSKFKQTVGRYVDKNSSKLHTPGPQYMIPFGDIDKGLFYKIFNISESEIVDVVNDVIKVIRGGGVNTDFRLLRGNPIFWLFYCVIRYYRVETKDTRGVNTALIIYALSVYPSIFHKYFPYGVSDVGAMQYTVDNLTEKFILKKTGHVFGMLSMSIQGSYTFLSQFMEDASDKEVIRFIQRIRNDQNSLIKKICDNYTKNHNAGKTVITTKDQFDNTPVFDTENNTTLIQVITQKILIPILTNGIDLKRAEICAKLAGISIADCRFYLSRIIILKNQQSISDFIESVLFLYLYTGQKNPVDINSSNFLVWATELFRKTNSNDANIGRIKKTLDVWAEESKIHAKFKREATRVNYKKAIYYYFILSIQAYNN